MVFLVALLPTVVHLDQLSITGFVEIAGVIVVVLPAVLGAYVLAAARARGLLRNPRAVRLVNRSGAAVMAGAAIAVARS
jgi:threonine/homoserine/homoserine lactone efflux protein